MTMGIMNRWIILLLSTWLLFQLGSVKAFGEESVIEIRRNLVFSHGATKRGNIQLDLDLYQQLNPH